MTTDVHVDQIDVEGLHNFMKKKLNEVPGEPFKARPVPIFRLPVWFHELNKEYCEPKIISIGPYHWGKDSLRAMEEYKWSTLRDFLARNENVGIEMYLRELRLLEAQVRACYSETVNKGSNEFVMMLLLDGCFILEFFLKVRTQQLDGALPASWAVGGVMIDLYLLENQIPFFVLHKLWTIQGWGCPNCTGNCPLLEIICEVISFQAVTFRFRQPQLSCSNVQHLLHLYYCGVLPDFQFGKEQRHLVAGKSYLWGFLWSIIFRKSSNVVSKTAKSTDDEELLSYELIQCATKLHEAGVKFRKKRRPHNMFDITFRNGTMEIPYVEIDGVLRNYLWNMVAFEQSQSWQFNKILTSYIGLMNSLIKSEKDVARLEQSGIISNLLQNDEQAATFFCQFSENFGLDYGNHHFHGLFKDVKRYSELTWHKHRARLVRDYFSSPWSIISVVAASILLILTFIMTYYSAAK
ncbi:hypothetical protein LUZ61_007984 [Rhynchospora tenuis]|uniref:Uncharacterized protein n=1 Tax=Rhynchospora tenuis TaxID=198213 RepID=A0AAD5ZUQ1_9POAL|nr:hypothetical protein LUZ61_007984 [Rhynchospora tenuis]